jgi:hypothetical protein
LATFNALYEPSFTSFSATLSSLAAWRILKFETYHRNSVDLYAKINRPLYLLFIVVAMTQPDLGSEFRNTTIVILVYA